jgi:hypothetical protein
MLCDNFALDNLSLSFLLTQLALETPIMLLTLLKFISDYNSV